MFAEAKSISTAASISKTYTKAGSAYKEALTAWLQDTRLMSEAIYRLYTDYQGRGTITFSGSSWPKGKSGYELTEFKIDPVPLGVRMDELLQKTWAAQFVFLEALWEEYLRGIVKELRDKDITIFEPLCDKEFMVEIIRDVLNDNLTSVDEIQDEVAIRFAQQLTHKPWEGQWKQLQKLRIGLSEKEDCQQQWYKDLDVYFELRNCIVHNKSQVSLQLNKKTDYYSKKRLAEITIWPPQLDHYRHQFLDCLFYIEGKIQARYSS